MKENIIKIGEIIYNKEGDKAIIVKKSEKPKYHTIQFCDEFHSEHDYSNTNLKRGVFRNKNKKTVFGKGYIGFGRPSKVDGKHIKSYRVWYSMLERCYSGKYDTYDKVEVCDEWLSYQNFADWFDSSNYKDGYELDKDLKQYGTENKIYSPNTCIFLPQRINTFIRSMRRTNITGEIGISYHNSHKKWRAQTNDFDTGKNIVKYATNKEEALLIYKELRKIQIEKAKQYMRNLNEFNEDIISLIDNYN